MTQTEKIIAVVVVIVLIVGLAVAFAFWRFREDARLYLADVDTSATLLEDLSPPES